MARGIDYKLNIDEQKAVNALRNMTEAERKAALGMNQFAKSGKRAKTTSDKLGESVKAAALTYVSLQGAVQGLRAGLATLEKMDQYMRGIADRSNEASKSLISLAAMSDPATVKRAAASGLKYGIAPAQAGSVYQTSLSFYEGDHDKAEKLAAAVMEGMRLGLERETAQKMGQLKGTGGPRRGVAMGYEAAVQSKWTPAELARGVRGAAFFNDKAFGLAALAALSRTEAIDPEQSPTYAAQGALGLQVDTALSKKVAKHLKRGGGNYEALREEGRFNAIGDYLMNVEALKRAKREGISLERAQEEAFSIGQLKRAGIPEKRQATALSVMLQNREFVNKNAGGLRGISAEGNELAAYWQTALKTPGVAKNYRDDMTMAQHAYRDLYSPEAEQAYSVDAKHRRRGLQMRQLGFGAWTDEMGRPEWGWGGFWGALESGGQYAVHSGAPGYTQPAVRNQGSEIERLEKVLHEDLQAINQSVENSNKETTDAVKDASPKARPIRNAGT